MCVRLCVVSACAWCPPVCVFATVCARLCVCARACVFTWMASTSWVSSWISFTSRWYFCWGVSFTPLPSPSYMHTRVDQTHTQGRRTRAPSESLDALSYSIVYHSRARHLACSTKRKNEGKKNNAAFPIGMTQGADLLQPIIWDHAITGRGKYLRSHILLTRSPPFCSDWFCLRSLTK